jgi:arylsulfatase A
MKPILTFFCILLLVSPGFAQDKKPNVVTLLVDDLGYRDIGCYGGPVKTPVLDQLAAEGVRFTDFHSGAPSCSPSRATFLTGRQHRRTGVYSVITERHHRMHLLESETTIAEVLKENGYATAHFGKWHLGMPVHGRDNPTPADHGFDYWFGLVNGPGPSHRNPTQFLRNGERVGETKGYSCQLVVDEALTWLDEQRNGDEPFFLNLWFNEPHAPIAAPDEIVSLYGALNDQAAIYSGTIDNTDRAIGRLVARLEKLGELDNTIIVYSSDNGSYRQERSGELRGKKGSLFEGGHRVPGIIYWKDGIPGDRVEDEPAGAVDLLPTLCGLIGIDKPAGVHLDGSDLAPLLTQSGNFTRYQPLFWMSESNMVMRVGDHTLFASSTAKSPIDFKAANRLTEQIKEALGDDLEEVLGGMELRSRLFNGKLDHPEAERLRNQLRDMFYFQESWIPELKQGELRGVQLYDLSNDLGQQNNIAKQRPQLAARLKEQAATIHRSVMADAPEWPSAGEPKVTKKPAANSPRQPAATGSKTPADPKKAMAAKLKTMVDAGKLTEKESIGLYLAAFPGEADKREQVRPGEDLAKLIESGKFDSTPFEAVDLALEQNDPKPRGAALSAAFGRLGGGVGGVKLAAVVERVESLADERDKNFAINGLAHGLVSKDPEAALKWANSISEEGFRKSVVENVTRRMKTRPLRPGKRTGGPKE